MKRVFEKWTLWLPPLLATLFFLVLSRITYFRYENSDDFLIARAFLGFEGVRPVLPHLYLHPVLVRGLVFGGADGSAVAVGGGTVLLPSALRKGCAPASRRL